MYNRFTAYNWQVLFNFACNIGQGWTTTYTVNNSSTPIRTLSVTVDSIKTIIENGFSLKRMFVSLANSYMSNDSITERYGWGYLFKYMGRTNSCDGDFLMGTILYSDSAFGVKSFSAPNCNPSNPSGMETEGYSPQLQVLPNPFIRCIYLSADGIASDMPVEIIDQFGKVIFADEVRIPGYVDLPNAAPGLYMLRYKIDNHLRTSKLIRLASD